MNLNKVFILGNVTRQPEVKALPSGQSVTSFGLATNRFYTDNTGTKKQDAEFHNVVAFGKLADICSRYLNKGSLVFIEGRLKTRSWQSLSGSKQYRTEVIANNIQLGPRSTAGTAAPMMEESKSEEIPIIEENYSPRPNENPDTSINETPDQPKENDDLQEDEINVSQIPF
ncbi:single-stranded DNA-binding protein [Patescibacteria group bacterium]|nr:single-stranded DNA-binding protein [Patescibacteria group bacterium]MBU4275055.1 single-stranded DNA-binding protein [Patescibacteria group bacterium]MBU4367488.1 single-stranded DNA-binding protein [Patescibacteria group bacterium]MBU4462023.1 single-stranded DNA-binding protein [Patescibacteria group bacterium]MCG2700480.1 single-stranded DNA-binding protein [Candidatus Parcubacteria bacterium]